MQTPCSAGPDVRRLCSTGALDCASVGSMVNMFAAEPGGIPRGSRDLAVWPTKQL